MVAKFTRKSVQFDFAADFDPHVVYANLDFRKPTVRKDARPLLRWLSLYGPYKWEDDYRRTLRYLRKHQKQFRNCLEWITEDCPADFSDHFETEDENTEYESRDKWEHYPPLKFFRQHALAHAGVTFEPSWQEYSRLSGLRLTQQKLRDPLDSICWHVLSMLVHWGTTFVRRCRYKKCGKFFDPPTQRRIFCSDSCRALSHIHVPLFEDESEAIRKKNRDYMRSWRANPLVKRRAISRKR